LRMRVLGVDPGTLVVGFGVLEMAGGRTQVLDFGCVRLRSSQAFPERLKKIYDEITRVVCQFDPEHMAIESLFYAKNPKVAIKMGHARGVVMVAAANQAVPTSEYSPREIKLSVAGNGAASKEQVQRMLKQILNLRELPQPLDASDALAAALCHVHRMNAPV